MADFFDLNTYGTDTNLQFMNWAVHNNGANDCAADTRGLTFAAMVEYPFSAFGLHYAVNPGYNRDRGLVIVPTLRLHLEF